MRGPGECTRFPVASIAARRGFGRGMASPGVIHADVVVWIHRAEQHARRRRAPSDRPSSFAPLRSGSVAMLSRECGHVVNARAGRVHPVPGRFDCGASGVRARHGLAPTRYGWCRGEAMPRPESFMPTPSSCGSSGLNSTPVGVAHRVTARHHLLRFDQEVSQCSRESVGML